MLGIRCGELMTRAGNFLAQALPKFDIHCQPLAGTGSSRMATTSTFDLERHAIDTNERPV
jgi:hypothetical protein